MKFYTPEELAVIKKRKKVLAYVGIIGAVIILAAVVPILAHNVW